MNTIEIIDYLPKIHNRNPDSALLYTIIKHFTSKQGTCTLTLLEVANSLGFSDERFEKAKIILDDYVKIKNGTVIWMTPSQRENDRIDTILEKKGFEEIPTEYSVLYDPIQMYICYRMLGEVLWGVYTSIVQYFKLDIPTAIRLMDNPIFKQKVLETKEAVTNIIPVLEQRIPNKKGKKSESYFREQVILNLNVFQGKIDTPMVPQVVVATVEAIKKKEKTIPELTQQLYNEVHLSNGEEIPPENWKTVQLLRAYCLMYKKRYNEEYRFITNPFSSLEMREVKKIYDAFGQQALNVLSYFKWVFGKKSYTAGISNPLVIRFASSDNVIREFMRLQEQGTTGESTTPVVTTGVLLPTSFIEWVCVKYPDIQDSYRLAKIEDLKWMKKACDSGYTEDERLKIILDKVLELGISL